MSEMGGELPTTYVSQPGASGRKFGKFDLSVLHTLTGLLKVAVIGFCILGMIFMAFARTSSDTVSKFFQFLTTVSIIVVVSQLLLLSLHLRERLQRLTPPPLVELIYSAIWCFMYFAGSISLAVNGSSYMGQFPLIGLVFLGFIVMCLYGYEAFTMFSVWRTSSVPVQNHVSTPTY